MAYVLFSFLSRTASGATLCCSRIRKACLRQSERNVLTSNVQIRYDVITQICKAIDGLKALYAFYKQKKQKIRLVFYTEAIHIYPLCLTALAFYDFWRICIWQACMSEITNKDLPENFS